MAIKIGVVRGGRYVTISRIQRKRTKGWRLPATSRCVTRPGTFGNPFPTAAEFRVWLERLLDGKLKPACDTPQAKRMEVIASRIEELRGLNLACYCELDADCHADVLMEFANKID